MPLLSKFRVQVADDTEITYSVEPGTWMRVVRLSDRVTGSMSHTLAVMTGVSNTSVDHHWAFLPTHDRSYLQGIRDRIPDDAKRFLFLGFNFTGPESTLFRLGWDGEGTPLLSEMNVRRAMFAMLLPSRAAARASNYSIDFSPNTWAVHQVWPALEPIPSGMMLDWRCRRDRQVVANRRKTRTRLFQVGISRHPVVPLDPQENEWLQRYRSNIAANARDMERHRTSDNEIPLMEPVGMSAVDTLFNNLRTRAEGMAAAPHPEPPATQRPPTTWRGGFINPTPAPDIAGIEIPWEEPPPPDTFNFPNP